jgi:hypothetical protein
VGALTVAVIQRVRPRGLGVVYPERDTGKRVAHLISGRLMDYIEFDDGFGMVKMRAPRAISGVPSRTPRCAAGTASPWTG